MHYAEQMAEQFGGIAEAVGGLLNNLTLPGVLLSLAVFLTMLKLHRISHVIVGAARSCSMTVRRRNGLTQVVVKANGLGHWMRLSISWKKIC